MAGINESSTNVTNNSVNMTMNVSFIGEEIGPVARAFFIGVGSVEVTSGTVVSCLLLLVLLTGRSLGMRSLHYKFIANLALADLLSTGYWMSFFVLDLILGYHPVVNKVHCVVNGFLISLCTIVSILSLVSISLNRYLHVCHNRLYSRIFTKRRTIVWCFLLWVLAAAIAGPPLFGVGLYYYKVQIHGCTFNAATYPKSMAIIIMLESALMIGYFNIAIFRFWKRAHLKPKHRFFVVSKRSRWKCGCLTFVRHTDHGHVSDTRNIEKSRETETEETTTTSVKESENTALSAVEPSRVSSISKEDSEPEADAGSDELQNISKEDIGLRTDDLSGKYEQCPEEQLVDNLVLESSVGIRSTSALKMCNESSPLERSFRIARVGSHMKQFSRRRRKLEARDKAFVRSLFVVFLLTMVTLLPSGISRMVETYHKLSVEVTISVTLIHFSNNAVNWIVYGVMNRSFRRGYITLVRRVTGTCCREPCETTS